MEILRNLKDRLQGKLNGAKRSSKWPAVRKQHLGLNPACAVCGGTKKVEVHHKKPFHLHPELELEPTNLISLCEAKKNGINCHLFFGHLGNFKGVNPEVEGDAQLWAARLSSKKSPPGATSGS